MIKALAWVASGLILLISIPMSVAGAVNAKHISISDKVIRYTEDKYGPKAASRVVAWNKFIMDNKNKSIAEKLELTNNFFNRIPIESNTAMGDHERWSTPFEMLTRNAGSHADHAIGKYVTLEALGIGTNHLQITHVHSAAVPDHMYMVLTYSPEPTAMPLVLDTVVGEIKPANERHDLFPQDSFNDNGLWLPREQEDGSHSGRAESVTHIEAVEHIELWNEMNARMAQEFISLPYPDKQTILKGVKK